MIADTTSRFADATADITDPKNLELAQATFNEELLYEAIVSFASDWFARVQRPARILDLCAATGLTAKKVSDAISTDSVTLVDNSPQALSESHGHFPTNLPVRRCCVDAVTFTSDTHYDIILANSAYHHIEDDRKGAFLRNATCLLSRDGILILGDHFLPAYVDEAGHARATEQFYCALVSELETRNSNPRAIEVIRSAANHGVRSNGEYKVCWSYFLSSLDSTRLLLQTFKLVWTHPLSRAKQLVGSVASVLKADFRPVS
ncbi:MAG TPA: class I SAM-dependent methyltransferase [Chthoniobacterales bacterium]|nr:class I SAM-dependent methyltransferase [Chthoniobacterales bacterium]